MKVEYSYALQSVASVEYYLFLTRRSQQDYEWIRIEMTHSDSSGKKKMLYHLTIFFFAEVGGRG